MKYKKTLLLILDGFGLNPSQYGNAVMAADMGTYRNFLAHNPHNQLTASGTQVGLPEGIMGNSEVGHLNIGSGRIAYQLNVKMDKQIAEGTFSQNPAFVSAVEHAVKNDSSLHLMGLMSNGNVHSNMAHIYPILEMAKARGLQKVYIHAFMDGRDTLPHSGKDFLEDMEAKLAEIGVGKIATLSGRYYAMDRDKNWDRVELAYRALIFGEGQKYTTAGEAIEASYANDITDEFVQPCMITSGSEAATINHNDSVIFFNYRADRAREITSSMIYGDFSEFKTKKLSNLHFVSFSEYHKDFNDHLRVAYPPDAFPDGLAETVSKHGLKQLHLAETEKYAHVTFFFNGGREEPFAGEDRILIPSPKVATYDLQPEMSAFQVKDALVNALESQKYHFIVTNFANPDMVGHTGDFSATVKALEAVDSCLAEVLPAAENHGYNIILIADHGNSDEMLDKDGNLLTQHSTNPVPVIVSRRDNRNYSVKEGILADVAPTILYLMGIDVPEKMGGKILLTEK